MTSPKDMCSVVRDRLLLEPAAVWAANVSWTTEFFFSDDAAAARKAVRNSGLASRFLGDQWHAAQNVKKSAKKDCMSAADFIILHHL